MANVGETLPHCTGTGTQADPYIYTTEEGFKEAIAVIKSYVEAGESNLSFDANNGVITQVTFRCSYIDGKGTTIRNLFTQNSNTTLVYFQSDTNGYAIEVDNMNFYNMYISTTSVWHKARFVYDAGSNYQNHTKFFKNCNFTGVYRGNPHASEDAIVQANQSNAMAFKNCTFNFNCDSYSNVDYFYLFKGTGGYPIELSNCVVCISGKILTNSNYPIRLCYNAILDNCTFTNTSTNPLKIASGINSYVEINLASSGVKYSNTYNYVKLYLDHGTYTGSRVSVNNNHVLLNTTRLGVETVQGGIQMQEDTPSADDYIYNAENLANAGFLVGQVIP